MGIRFQCDVCGKKLHVKAYLAGKRAVCPHCKGSIAIPDQPEASQSEPSENHTDDPVPAIPNVGEDIAETVVAASPASNAGSEKKPSSARKPKARRNPNAGKNVKLPAQSGATITTKVPRTDLPKSKARPKGASDGQTAAFPISPDTANPIEAEARKRASTQQDGDPAAKKKSSRAKPTDKSVEKPSRDADRTLAGPAPGTGPGQTVTSFVPYSDEDPANPKPASTPSIVPASSMETVKQEDVPAAGGAPSAATTAPRDGGQPPQQSTMETVAAPSSHPLVGSSNPVMNDGGETTAGAASPIADAEQHTPTMPIEAIPNHPLATGSSAPPVPGAVDPIEENIEAIWYVRPPSGGQFGPAAGDLFRRWKEEGRVAANSLVWREGWDDWLPAGQVFPTLVQNPPGDVPGESTIPANAMPGQTIPADGMPVPASGMQPEAKIDESANKVLAYRKKRARSGIWAVAALVFLSLLVVGLAILLFVIASV